MTHDFVTIKNRSAKSQQNENFEIYWPDIFIVSDRQYDGGSGCQAGSHKTSTCFTCSCDQRRLSTPLHVAR